MIRAISGALILLVLCLWGALGLHLMLGMEWQWRLPVGLWVLVTFWWSTMGITGGKR